MKSTTIFIITGIALMLMGLFLLLDQFGIVESSSYAPLFIFAALGSVFVIVFLRRRENWWAAIPGSVFLGLAAVIAATWFTEEGAVGAFLLLFMAAGFGAVYMRERTYWWALIPCGVLSILALLVVLSEVLQGTWAATVLFLGLAATFGLLTTVPVRLHGGTERMRWPLVPAAVLGTLGVIFALQSAVQLIPGDTVALAVVILAGVALMAYGYRARSAR